MAIIDYTTLNDIRAALGVNEEELEDGVITLDLYHNSLVADLEDVNLLIPDKFREVKDLLVKTSEEERFLNCVQVFSTYAVARQLSITLPQFSPQRLEDGKAGMARVTDPHTATIKAINGEFDRWRKRLIDAFSTLESIAADSVPRFYVGVVSPSEDPVTGGA